MGTSGDYQTALGVFEDCNGLLARDTRKPIEKIVNSRAAFKVLKQRPHRHAAAFEYPRAT